MMWLLQLILETALPVACVEAALNLLFAGLCLLASWGLCPVWTMRLSALLYLALALCAAMS